MTQSIKELAAIRRNWVEASRENEFETGIKRLLTDLYPDNAHFIYELLQNAEDAHAQEVRFILHEDRIEFEHDGKRLFSIKDVSAITSIGSSAKQKDDTTNIGKFGVGFKAVFAYTDTPEIASGEFYFRIRDMVVPEQVSMSDRVSMNGQTRFILPFDNPKKPAYQAMSEIEKLLKTLDSATLLFLRYIRKIEYLLPDSSVGYIERIELGNSRFEIRVQQPDELAPLSTWFLKFDKEVQVEDEESDNDEYKVKICRIAVAFGMLPVEAKADSKKKKDNDCAKAKHEWEIVPMDPGSVCIYFPADKETSNLRFHLHAPFASTVARDSVRDCTGNNTLRNHLADLIAESMHEIRDQSLLTVHSMALLPNDKDYLAEFYKPIMVRLVAEFKDQELVPMKCGGHAAASGIFRGKRNLSDLIDDDDMVTLLGNEYFPPMWVANPTQKNQREDNFLSMLEIVQWSIADLVKTLGEMDEDVRGEWMRKKSGEWHQGLYELLFDYLNSAPKYPYAAAAERKDSITHIGFVRCSDGNYRKGNDCFFPSEEIENDEKFPRVAKSTYISDKGENTDARGFLEALGVREVDEAVEIEAFLRARYSKEFKPDLNDTKRFIEFADKHPDDVVRIFNNNAVFKLKSGYWGTPQDLYLDEPYLKTGLSVWYDWKGEQADREPLSDDYQKLTIKPSEIGQFAKKLNALTKLQIEKTKVPNNHPEWDYLIRHGGDRSTGSGTNEDYHIHGLVDFLVFSLINKSRLIWQTMKNSCDGDYCQYLRARFGKNASNIAKAKSTLIHTLRAAEWVPQKNGEKIEFVMPSEAVAEKLPEGFEYQTGWKWLLDLEFGKSVEERRESHRRDKDSQTVEYKKKDELAKDLGFESQEEAEEIARRKKEDPEGYNKWINSCKKKSSFPTRPVKNPDRRQERLGEQLSDAPKKEYEKRNRSVRISNGAIDPIIWLRYQYTNEDDQMFCQICKKEMPFRKRDGAHYFEKKEVLSKKYLPKEHEAQYLALCPLCAAKYEEFVKSDEDVMAELKEAIVSADDCEVPISLGDQEDSIRFVETHYQDIKSILKKMG